MIDIEYQIKRDKLTSKAESFANSQYGKRPPKGSDRDKQEWAANWNRCYHGRMNELMREVL